MMLKAAGRWEPVRLVTATDAQQAMKIAEALRLALSSADARFDGATLCVEEVEPAPESSGGEGGGREDRSSSKGGYGG